MPAQRLEQGVSRGNPFQVVPFGGVAVCRQARVAGRQVRMLPVRVALVLLQSRRCAAGIEGMRQPAHRPQSQGRVSGALGDEARDALGHHPPLLRAGAALDEHGEVELLGGQPFQRRLADGAETVLVHVLQEAVLEVFLAQLAGVEVAQHTLHVRGRQDLAHDVEYRVVVEGVADLLELVQQPLQDPTLDGVGRDEVEDQAVEPLSVAVDTAHSLFEAVRIPRDVVVEEDVAALQVDAFAGRLGGDQDLDGAISELLLGVEPGSRFVA